MSKKEEVIRNDGERELVIKRTFNAPRELVWEAWTEPAHLIRWWGPNGFTNTFHEIDVKPGGIWRFIMHGPDGVDYPNKIVYDEVIKPQLLVYTHGDDSDNETGKFKVTVRFEKEGNKTNLTMTMRFTSVEERDKVVKEYGAIEGAKQTLSRLEQLLETMQ